MEQNMKHIENYFNVTSEVTQVIDLHSIANMAHQLKDLRERQGRLFVLGVGGSAANASHAVNDFRKLCKIETYAPTDNVSELTARTNDEGWETVFAEWLITSNINENDAILVLSVGGGNIEKNVSVNLIHAVKCAEQKQAKILAIVGKDGGYVGTVADVAVIIPPLDPTLITPISEAFQAVVWHCLVSHPLLQVNQTKW